MDRLRTIERILYQLMMDAIEAHPKIAGQLTTSDYQSVMEAKAAKAARQILAL